MVCSGTLLCLVPHFRVFLCLSPLLAPALLHVPMDQGARKGMGPTGEAAKDNLGKCTGYLFTDGSLTLGLSSLECQLEPQEGIWHPV